MPAPVYQFGDFRLDSGLFELTRDGRSVAVERKPMELLILFVERSGELITRAEMAERLWDPAVFVDTEHGINTAVRKVRQALRDDREEPRYVQTVTGRGYRFIAPVAGCPVVSLEALAPASSDAGLPAMAEVAPGAIEGTARRSGWRRLAGGVVVLVAGASVGMRLLPGRGHPGVSAVSPVAAVATVDPPTAAVTRPEAAAREAYAQGNYLWFRGNPEALWYFQKAVTLAPGYAPGWIGLSNFYGQAAGGPMEPSEALPLAEEAAIKAVQLDPASAEAHGARAMVYVIVRWDWPRGEAELARAVALEPQYAQGWHLRGKVLAMLNRYEEAIASQKKASEIAPFERPWGTADVYNLSRRYDSAIDDLQRRLEATPRDAVLTLKLFETYRRKGMKTEAVRALTKGCVLGGRTHCAAEVQRSFAQGGYPAVVRWRMAEWKIRAKTQYATPVDLASLYAELGEGDRALTLLEQAYRAHDPNLLYVQSDPAFDFLHGEERYRGLIQKVGLPPAW